MLNEQLEKRHWNISELFFFCSLLIFETMLESSFFFFFYFCRTHNFFSLLLFCFFVYKISNWTFETSYVWSMSIWVYTKCIFHYFFQFGFVCVSFSEVFFISSYSLNKRLKLKVTADLDSMCMSTVTKE